MENERMKDELANVMNPNRRSLSSEEVSKL